jgi:cysteine protease ATG4
MESAINTVDLGARRIVQMFWDPEPVNDRSAGQPVWCLGYSYDNSHDVKVDAHAQGPTHTEQRVSTAQKIPPEAPGPSTGKTIPLPPVNAPETPPESFSSSFSSSLAYGENGEQQQHIESGWPQGFLDDFSSRFWMTYRSEFETIAKSSDPKATSSLSFAMRMRSQFGADQTGFSSDSGWGCMIRSGQSLLANTLAMVHLGRDWRKGSEQAKERQLISLFADDPRAPYSIHQFVNHGARACGKYPGEWFGPSATARCIQALTNDHDSSLRVYSTGDSPDVYMESFMKIAKPDGKEFKPTLILVGTRLGIDKINPVYWEALMATLQMPQSIGIAGGRPSASHYFVGAQGSGPNAQLFYLDPHHTRKALPFHQNPDDYTDEEVSSCHTTRLRRIHVREMDPSMLIGFLIQSEEDWVEWRKCVKHVPGKAIIHVSDQDPMLPGAAEARESAIDEVEILSDDDGDTVLDG